MWFYVSNVSIYVIFFQFHFNVQGAQKAHRAVHNEALYGVLRISRLITWTYLHQFRTFSMSAFPSFNWHGTGLSHSHPTFLTISTTSCRGLCFCCNLIFYFKLNLFLLPSDFNCTGYGDRSFVIPLPGLFADPLLSGVPSNASSKKAPRQQGVCVNHLNRCKCKTSKLWFCGFTFQMFQFMAISFQLAGGHRRPIELCPTKLSMVSLCVLRMSRLIT